MTCVVCTLEIDDGDILLDLECGHSIGLWPQVGQAITPDPFRGGVNVSFAGVLLSQTERIMPEDWRVVKGLYGFSLIYSGSWLPAFRWLVQLQKSRFQIPSVLQVPCVVDPVRSFSGEVRPPRSSRSM